MIADLPVARADAEALIWVLIIVGAAVFNLVKKGIEKHNRSAPSRRAPGPAASPGPPPAPAASPPRPHGESGPSIDEYFENLRRQFQKQEAPAPPKRAARRPPPPPPPRPVAPPPPVEVPEPDDLALVPPPVRADQGAVGNPLSMGRAGSNLSARAMAKAMRVPGEPLRMPMVGLQMRIGTGTMKPPAARPALRRRLDVQRAIAAGIVLGPPRSLQSTVDEFRVRIGAS